LVQFSIGSHFSSIYLPPSEIDYPKLNESKLYISLEADQIENPTMAGRLNFEEIKW
jgi:hypothetical protein